MSQTMELLFVRLCGNMGPQKLNFEVSPYLNEITIETSSSGAIFEGKPHKKSIKVIQIYMFFCLLFVDKRCFCW